MATKVIVELLQSLGRLPGLSFLDAYANRVIGAKHTQEDHVGTVDELRGRVAEVAERTEAVLGRGRDGGDASGRRDRSGSGSGSARDSLRHGGPSNAARLREGAGPPPPRERLRRRPDRLD